MFAELLQLLIGSINYLWPAHIVLEWECSGQYINGKFRRIVRKGLWPKVPFFMKYIDVTLVPYPMTTGRLDITLSDGSTLSFDATARVVVVDPEKALNLIDNYHAAAGTVIAAVLATKLAEVDAARLAPAVRKRLLTDLRRWINEDINAFGVEAQFIAFNSFVLNLKTFRLLTDTSAPLSKLLAED